MKKSLVETLKEVELSKEIYRLYALEHLTMIEISENVGMFTVKFVLLKPKTQNWQKK